MNVVIKGDQDQTIVLLPGYGTASPALDFQSLAEELKSDYRVVTVEPFGYGLSDTIDDIAGIYGLYYSELPIV